MSTKARNAVLKALREPADLFEDGTMIRIDNGDRNLYYKEQGNWQTLNITDGDIADIADIEFPTIVDRIRHATADKDTIVEVNDRWKELTL